MGGWESGCEVVERMEDVWVVVRMDVDLHLHLHLYSPDRIAIQRVGKGRTLIGQEDLQKAQC